MLDIRYIFNNMEQVKQALARRNSNFDAQVDKAVSLYENLRQRLQQVEQLKAQSNKNSATIAQLVKQNKDTASIKTQVSADKENIKQLDIQISVIEEELQAILSILPNIPHDTVLQGQDASDNILVRSFGQLRQFDFEPKPHWEIGNNLAIIDSSSAASVTGSRFSNMRGLGARLERALINLMLDTHTSRGYTEMWTPFMVNSNSMYGTGQLPKFEEDMFRIADTDYYLIPTSEVPLTNIHKDSIMQLPISYCAFTPCFRKEAGSAGRDVRGLIRQHQFSKVELVKFCQPQDSYCALEQLTQDAEYILQLLDLPYRVVTLSSGDLGFSSAKTYDIEVWMPSYNKYVEVSSCSNFEDFQARRAKIRYRDNDNKVKLVHTLNGSGLAIGRTIAAILENCQSKEGTVVLPKVLHHYMGTATIS